MAKRGVNWRYINIPLQQIYANSKEEGGLIIEGAVISSEYGMFAEYLLISHAGFFKDCYRIHQARSSRLCTCA